MRGRFYCSYESTARGVWKGPEQGEKAVDRTWPADWTGHERTERKTKERKHRLGGGTKREGLNAWPKLKTGEGKPTTSWRRLG